MPSTSTTFAGDPWPLTMAMLEASILRRSASRAMTASLARPFSGGALIFTFTLSESPSQPTISFHTVARINWDGPNNLWAQQATTNSNQPP